MCDEAVQGIIRHIVLTGGPGATTFGPRLEWMYWSLKAAVVWNRKIVAGYGFREWVMMK